MFLGVGDKSGDSLLNYKLTGKTIFSAVLSAVLVVSGCLSVEAQTQYIQQLTSSVSVVGAAPATPAPQLGSPGTGPTGNQGYEGGYYCNQMTWGAACAAFYSFGSPTIFNSGNGNKAPSGASGVDISNNSPATVFASSTGSPAGGSYDVVVTQLASAMRWSTSTAANLQATDILNSGHAFDVVLSPQGGSAVTIAMAANSTLNDVKNAINARFSDGSFVASVNTANSAAVLAAQGLSGAGHDFTIVTVARDAGGAPVLTGGSPTEVTGLGFSLPSPVTITDSNNNTTTYTPLGAASQDALYSFGGTSYNATSNTVTANGLTLNLLNLGTSTLTITPLSGTVPNGVAGTTGTDGAAIDRNVTARNITINGNRTAFNYSSTGGQGGAAGIGGTGGTGGAGGVGVHGTIPEIMVIIFPPLTIPNTQSYALTGGIGGEGAQGGTGGQGGVGGLGGDIQLNLVSSLAKSSVLSTLTSVGGVGGTGGQGGQGGCCGH